ncbi:MAG: hypothetical protein IPO58_01885 [Betaproteobacteria bacterium]|nr:hypothetical protein [Betaproteobacteria bacterium]
MRIPVCTAPAIGAYLVATIAFGAVSLDGTQVTPDVVRFDRTTPVTITARTSGSKPTQVQFAAADGTTLTMRDDGQDGDAAANDGIYTVQISANLAVGGLQDADVFRKHLGFVDVYEGATRTFHGFDAVAGVDPAIGEVAIADDGVQVQHSNHVVNIVDPATFANGPTADFRPLIQRFYQLFPDSVDFIDIVFATRNAANRYHFSVRNAVSGIGSSNFNNTAIYGSGGRLLGISVFPTSTYFDAGQEAHSHEIGHQWINFLPQASLSIGTPHWPLSSLASGLMGFSIPGSGAGGDYSCRLTSIPTGVQLTAFSGARSFSDLDLYLMGPEVRGAGPITTCGRTSRRR